MARHALTDNFRRFFSNLNPSATLEAIASREYNAIKNLIEKTDGPAAPLSPYCFLQGSYRQATAIYTINDIDIVALCRGLWFPGGSGKSWSRDEIFATIATPLLSDKRYASKIRYGPQSMCIKVDLGINIEILPVVFKSGSNDPAREPFSLYRPENRRWEDGYARNHQAYLSSKNRKERTNGNFIPVVKVLKHLRSLHGLQAVSFHIECLLHAIPDNVYAGGPADFIPAVLANIARFTAAAWYASDIHTPCLDRRLFSPSEWQRDLWLHFHRVALEWSTQAIAADTALDRSTAVSLWQQLLGPDYFPREVE